MKPLIHHLLPTLLLIAGVSTGSAEESGKSAGTAPQGTGTEQGQPLKRQDIPDVAWKTIDERVDAKEIERISRVDINGTTYFSADIGDRALWVDDKGTFINWGDSLDYGYSSATRNRTGELPDSHPSENRDEGVFDLETYDEDVYDGYDGELGYDAGYGYDGGLGYDAGYGDDYGYYGGYGTDSDDFGYDYDYGYGGETWSWNDDIGDDSFGYDPEYYENDSWDW